MVEDTPDMGKAVVMHQRGSPSVLALEQVALPALARGEIRIHSIASAVNHSDLEIRAGTYPIFKAQPFPYIPGLEVIGEVVAAGADVGEFRKGDGVITMMQGLGGVRARRPGGYQEFVTVGAEAAAPVPPDLDPLAMAALGLGAVTAYEGLRKLGHLAGRRIAVVGAAGGVGSSAVAIAKAQGAAVTAIVSRPAQRDYVRSLGADEIVLAADAAAGALGSETLDGLLDAVAGEGFGAFVEALRPGAVLSLVGAVGGSKVEFDAYRLLEVMLTGYSSETLDGAALRTAIVAIGDWLRAGKLTPPSYALYPLEDAARAHARLEAHDVRGRLLLVPKA